MDWVLNSVVRMVESSCDFFAMRYRRFIFKKVKNLGSVTAYFGLLKKILPRSKRKEVCAVVGMCVEDVPASTILQFGVCGRTVLFSGEYE